MTPKPSLIVSVASGWIPCFDAVTDVLVAARVGVRRKAAVYLLLVLRVLGFVPLSFLDRVNEMGTFPSMHAAGSSFRLERRCRAMMISVRDYKRG